MKRERDVVVLSLDAPTENDGRALEIARYMGAQASGTTLGDAVPSSTCLIVAADTLVRGTGADGTALRNLIGTADHVVVYGFEEGDGHADLLRALSSDALTGIQPLSEPGSVFGVAEGYRLFCGPLSGLLLGRVDAAADRGFIVGSGAGHVETLIRAGDHPFLARTMFGPTRVYFIGRSDLADLDAPVQRGSSALGWFSRLAPLMMVLRGALGDRVWRNESPGACFIIDDPLLTRRYGFLEYQRLVETMRPHRFFPCVAFIPWNYARSNKDVAALLATQYREPFLCVHGCDHTRAEFATTDLRMLEARAHLALQRMRQQARTTGVAFDDVMVFPQGLFSSEAIQALKATGYLAAVNSDVCPSASESPLRLRDLVDVAVMRFDFPLFGRRYPTDVAESAFDLFLGKPALLVEHHGYFRDGYDALASFVQRLNALEPGLEWASLGRVCARASVVRSTPDGETAVRFFTSRFSLSNTSTRPQSFVLTRSQASNSPAPPVRINNREWAVDLAAAQLTLRLTLEPGETAAVQVGAPGIECAPRPTVTSPRYATSVRIRRYLSEFRDNHVDTSPALHAVVAAARAIRRGGKVPVAAPRAVNL